MRPVLILPCLGTAQSVLHVQEPHPRCSEEANMQLDALLSLIVDLRAGTFILLSANPQKIIKRSQRNVVPCTISLGTGYLR